MARRGPPPTDSQNGIQMQHLNHGYMEPAVEDADGYVDPTAAQTAAQIAASFEAPRRPSVPAHTKEIIKQLPSRNLDDLSTAEPHSIALEQATADTPATTMRTRFDARYLTLRVRNAAAHKTSDMNADDLYNILMSDPHLSNQAALQTLRDAKQSLTLKRSVRRRLTQRDARDHGRISWWRRTRYGLALVFEKAKYGVKDVLSHVDLWHSHLKVIQGNYGSGVTSYFLFLRRMFLLNLLLTVLMLGFVTIPQIIYDSVAGERRRQEVGYVNVVVNVFTGAGAFYDSLMYYGHYSNETFSLNGSLHYNMPFAYLLTMACCILACLVILASSLTKSYKRNYIETSMGTRDVYSTKVFAAWDFSIESREAAMLKSRSIYNELKELLSLEKRAETKEPFAVQAAKLVCKIFINVVILAIMAGSGCLVYFLLSKASLENDVPVLQEMTVALVVGALCFVIPTVFLVLSTWEFYRSVHIRLYINLVRVTLIKVVVLGVLAYFWLSSSHVKDQCWEDGLGQEVYRLLIVDTVFVWFLTSGVWEFGRGFVYRYLTPSIGAPELDVAHNTLDLIYTQTLVWFGIFYCPFLPLVASLKLLATFYIKRGSVMWTQPSVRPWRAVHAQTVFLVLTFCSFVLGTGALGYAVLCIQPSAVCGPFRGSTTTYDSVLQSLSGLFTGRLLTYVLSPFVVFLAILVLGLVLYYVRALASAHGEMVRLLREQLILEGKDKVFLLQLFEKAMEQRMPKAKDSPQAQGHLLPVSRGGSSEGSPRRGSAVDSLPRRVHQQGFRYLVAKDKSQ
ncbi:transmembrane channel-like protein 5 [Ornithodoros turicata]|uniref:transmembrane channel-like protein 5 n=1 Tax=Ornithodoros turicata TaxID=34597 RepID=UPI0031393AE6